MGKGIWLLISLIFGIGYGLGAGVIPAGALHVLVKMGGVAALAVYAWRQAAAETRTIALVLALGALGDGLIEFSLIAGALAFFAGHLVACRFYWRERRPGAAGAALAAPIGALVVLSDAAFAVSGRFETGIYALGLGAMAGMAWNSRFARSRVALGAMLFAASDLLLFARMGVLAHSPLPGLLVWPLYYGGQVLIAVGVVADQGRVTAPVLSRVSGAQAIATASGSTP